MVVNSDMTSFLQTAQFCRFCQPVLFLTFFKFLLFSDMYCFCLSALWIVFIISTAIFNPEYHSFV